MKSRATLSLMILAMVSLLALSVTSHAQSDTAEVSGRIFDPNSAVIVEATVTAKNINTGIATTIQTNEEGIYRFVDLGPGDYEFTVSKRGFKEILKPDVTLHVADTLSMNFTMQVGDVTEVVRVEAGAPLINTTDASVSTVIDRQFVENLPLNGRSFNTLLQLTPGVVIAPANYGSYGQFSISGQRTAANSFIVDGVSANFGVGLEQNVGESGTGGAQAFSALGGTSSLVSVDALQEFRIETSSFAPEFGKTPGGQVILTTRSGTNDYHGGVFDYFRNTVMDANDWFANEQGLPRAAEHHNDFGGFLGGPVRKDKTFFFFSYEGARLDLPQTYVAEVPSAYARSIASSAVAPYLNAFPEPDDKAITPGVFISPFTGSFANRATLDAVSLRIDHTFNQRFSIFGRYNYAPSQNVERTYGLSTVQTNPVNTQTFTFGINMFLSQEITNTLRANYSTQSSSVSDVLDSFGGAVVPDPSLLFGSLSPAETSVFFYVPGTSYYGVGSGGNNTTRQVNLTDSLALSTGTHQLKFGGDYRAIFLDENTYKNEILLEDPDLHTFVTTGSVILSPATNKPAQFLTQSFSLYGQDTWKLSPRLTMTYGLRWELSPPPSARGGTTLAAFENVNNPAETNLAPFGTPLWATTYGDFAPRVGVAYNLTPDGTFVVRAGGGIFYDLGVGSSAQLGFSTPNTTFSVYPSVSVPIANITSYLPSISLTPPYQYASGFVPNLVLPRSYQWNVAVEKSFRGRQTFTATYVGQAGRNLLRQEVLPQPNANFSGYVTLTANDAHSNYNALQLQYRRPLASRLQALFSYTWGHSLDNVSNDVTSGLSSTVISGVHDYASSDWDVRQNFSGALSFNVPAAAKSGALSILTRDWSLDGVIVARTGFPFNATVLDVGVEGLVLTRPDLVAGQPLWVPNASAGGGKSLDPNAFAVPTTPRQGTEGRNDIAGFGLTQLDLSVARKFPVTERLGVQFRADAFNVLNHPNFSNPYGYIQFGSAYLMSSEMLNQGLGAVGLNPLFNQGGPRSLQLSLRITF